MSYGAAVVDQRRRVRDVKFGCLARCEAPEHRGLASEGLEILEGERSVGVEDGGGRAIVEGGAF